MSLKILTLKLSKMPYNHHAMLLLWYNYLISFFYSSSMTKGDWRRSMELGKVMPCSKAVPLICHTLVINYHRYSRKIQFNFIRIWHSCLVWHRKSSSPLAFTLSDSGAVSLYIQVHCLKLLHKSETISIRYMNGTLFVTCLELVMILN